MCIRDRLDATSIDNALSSVYKLINGNKIILSLIHIFGEKTWEKAESAFQHRAVVKAIEKSGMTAADIDMLMAGDLLSQCSGSAFGARDLGIPFVGLYGACSTMALSLALAALSVDSGAARIAAAATSSHPAAVAVHWAVGGR